MSRRVTRKKQTLLMFTMTTKLIHTIRYGALKSWRDGQLNLAYGP